MWSRRAGIALAFIACSHLPTARAYDPSYDRARESAIAQIDIIERELERALGATELPPLSAECDVALGALKTYWDDLERGAAQAKHSLAPPDLSKPLDLCNRFSEIEPGQRRILEGLSDQIAEAENLRREASQAHTRMRVNIFNRAMTLQMSLLLAALDVPGSVGMMTDLGGVIADLADWATNDNPNNPTGPFMTRHSAEIAQAMDAWFRKWCQQGYGDVYKYGRDKIDCTKPGALKLLLQRSRFRDDYAAAYVAQVMLVADAKQSEYAERKSKLEYRKRELERTVSVSAANLEGYRAFCDKLAALRPWRPAVLQPAISLSMTATPSPIKSGDAITLRYTVSNPSEVTLGNVRVDDPDCAPATFLGGDDDGDGRLQPHETWLFSCATPVQSDTAKLATRQATARATAMPSGAPVAATAQTTFRITPNMTTVPDVLGLTQADAESAIAGARLHAAPQASRTPSREPAGFVVEQQPAPGTQVAVGSIVSFAVSHGREPVAERLFLDPPRTTIRIGETVTFEATLIYDTEPSRVLGPGDQLRWLGGDGNRFNAVAPGSFTVTAEYDVPGETRKVSGSATVIVEEAEKPAEPQRPISRAEDRDKRVPRAAPSDYTWYALCDLRSHDVVFGERPDATRHRTLGGPFPGPRTARDWIERNIPSWRCPPASGGPWKVMCNRNDLTLRIGQDFDAARFWTLAEGFAGQPEAAAWLRQQCPGGRCVEGGACAVAARRGGDWAAVCNRSHGGVGLTRNPDPTKFWVWNSGFFGEPDARMWVDQNCPSWRCDRDGQCLLGPTVGRDRPLETPPDLSRQSQDWAAIGKGESTVIEERPAPSEPERTPPPDISGYCARMIGEVRAAMSKGQYDRALGVLDAATAEGCTFEPPNLRDLILADQRRAVEAEEARQRTALERYCQEAAVAIDSARRRGQFAETADILATARARNCQFEPANIEQIIQAEAEQARLMQEHERQRQIQEFAQTLGRLGEALSRPRSPAPAATPPAAKAPAPPAPGPKTAEAPRQDPAACLAQGKQFQQQCDAQNRRWADERCRRGRNYSGCALDVVGCFSPFLPGWVFSREACSKPGFENCAGPAFSGYIGCLESCNSRDGEMGVMVACRNLCQQRMDTAMKHCR